MPAYTYRCRDCDHVFDLKQRMIDDPLEICPVCGGSVRRVINSVGVVFKGKGFYVTDNRRSSTLPSSGGAADSSAETATGEAKTESAPAAGETAKKAEAAKPSTTEKPT